MSIAIAMYLYAGFESARQKVQLSAQVIEMLAQETYVKVLSDIEDLNQRMFLYSTADVHKELAFKAGVWLGGCSKRPTKAAFVDFLESQLSSYVAKDCAILMKRLRSIHHLDGTPLLYARTVASAMEKALTSLENSTIHWVSANDTDSYSAPTCLWPNEPELILDVQKGFSEGSLVRVMHTPDPRNPAIQELLLTAKFLCRSTKVYLEAAQMEAFLTLNSRDDLLGLQAETKLRTKTKGLLTA